MDYYTQQYMRQTMGLFDTNAEETESVSPTLKELSLTVAITASFALEVAK